MIKKSLKGRIAKYSLEDDKKLNMLLMECKRFLNVLNQVLSNFQTINSVGTYFYVYSAIPQDELSD